jgi:hypothetical protein
MARRMASEQVKCWPMSAGWLLPRGRAPRLTSCRRRAYLLAVVYGAHPRCETILLTAPVRGARAVWRVARGQSQAGRPLRRD